MTLVRVWLDLSSMSIRRTSTTISVILFLYFNLNQKAIELNKITHRFFFANFFIYKNLHIEPFNYAINSVCFDFRSTNVGSSVIGTGRCEGSLLPYFYRFRCHYPFITYLTSAITTLFDIKKSDFHVKKEWLGQKYIPVKR